MCYLWHEELNHKGSSEIETCDFLQLTELASFDKEFEELIFYWDKCNLWTINEKIFFPMYLYAIITLHFKSIIHKFLTRRHTEWWRYCSFCSWKGHEKRKKGRVNLCAPLIHFYNSDCQKHNSTLRGQRGFLSRIIWFEGSSWWKRVQRHKTLWLRTD